MQRYKILHRTYYHFSGPVRFGPHKWHLRPREDDDLRIEYPFSDPSVPFHPPTAAFGNRVCGFREKSIRQAAGAGW
ncbi:transglutaminase N-terminal domain-containing protein [Desulfosarcina sp.]|uniref:transglutaminase N-terminal domain-containing protein n=1 Tax=Desulfosarcina sp. TaxID=2027861 RepID=UPI0035633802